MIDDSNLSSRMQRRWSISLGFVGTAVLAAAGISLIVSGGSALVQIPPVLSVLFGIAFMIGAAYLSLSFLPRPEYTKVLVFNIKHPIKKDAFAAQVLGRKYVWPISYTFFLMKAYATACGGSEEPTFVNETLEKINATGFFKASPGGEPRSDSNVMTAPLRDYFYDMVDFILLGWLAWWHTSEIQPIRSIRDLPANKRKKLLTTLDSGSLPASLTTNNQFLNPFPDLGENITVPTNSRIDYERAPFPMLTLESNVVRITLTIRLLRYGFDKDQLEGRLEILMKATGKLRSIFAQQMLHVADELVATLPSFLEAE